MKFLLTFFFFITCLAAGEFRIAATADLHGNLRNLALLAPQIRKNAPDLLLDAGDLTGGNLLAELDGGRSMIEALNLLKYDFRIPGNHDFDCPAENFAEQCRRFKGVTLGADWRWGKISGVPARVVTKGKFRLGIIGLTEPGLQRRHLPVASAPRCEEWEKALRRQIIRLRREKVHFILLLWHNGIDARPNGAAHVLKRFPEIDLVVAAHSHKENAGVRISNSYLVQPGAHGTSASLVRITYNDRTLKVEKISSCLLRGVPGERSADIDGLSKRAVKPFYPEIFRKVCRKGDLSYRNFPRLGAEALKKAGATQGAVFVCSTPGKGAGEQYRDLFRLMPYWNTLCTVELNRDELKALLEDLHKNSRKFKRTVWTAGFTWTPPSRRSKGRFQAPPVLSVTVSSYTMVTSPVLKKVLREKTPRWKHRGDLVERDVVKNHLVTRRSTSAVRQGR